MQERTPKIYNRNFTILLYPREDETHKKAIELIKKLFDYAMIEHTEDIWEDTTETHKKGDKKKPHTHVIIRVGSNPRWLSAVANELGIKENAIERL